MYSLISYSTLVYNIYNNINIMSNNKLHGGCRLQYEGVVELATKFEAQPSKPCWKTKTPHKNPADSQYWKRAMYLPFMGHVNCYRKLNTTFNGSRSRHGSVYHTETSRASDTKKNSQAVRSVPRRHAWRSTSTRKRSVSLEGKMKKL